MFMVGGRTAARLEEARKIGFRALEFSPRSASTFCVVQVLQLTAIICAIRQRCRFETVR